jgi:hypothetical protein
MDCGMRIWFVFRAPSSCQNFKLRNVPILLSANWQSAFEFRNPKSEIRNPIQPASERNTEFCVLTSVQPVRLNELRIFEFRISHSAIRIPQSAI